jgi:hypothetical protein
MSSFLGKNINFKEGFFLFLILPLILLSLIYGNIVLYPLFYLLKLNFINSKFYKIIYIINLIIIIPIILASK